MNAIAPKSWRIPHTASHWIDYFQQNSAEPPLPWNDRYRLTGAERAAVLASLQQFQLGEGAGGSRLLRSANARSSPDYVRALQLFVKEEQRHSRTLGRFLELHGVACLRRHWVHTSFRRLRGLAGIELCMRVLATAEVIAMPYYAALREATGSPLLQAICTRFLEEETAHLRFQAFTFYRLERGRGRLLRRLAWAAQKWLLLGTAGLVWVEHGAVFRAGGYSFKQFRRESLEQYERLRLGTYDI